MLEAPSLKAAIVTNCQEYIYSNVSFEYHVNRICRKANQILHALCRIAKYIFKNKKRMLLKFFIISQFNYCPIVWISHDRVLNNNITNIHERALRIAFQDKKSSFETLLKCYKSESCYLKNLQYLATVVFEVI